MDKKFGVIMVGKVNGETVMVAPYTEGRFSQEERAFSIPKGDPKYGNRKQDANSEFHEETGINIELLEKNPNHPARKSEDGGDLFGGAKIIKRLELLPHQYPANSGKPTELNLDVVVVENIAALIPHLKAHGEQFVPAKEQAAMQGVPAFGELLQTMHNHCLPKEIMTEQAFDEFIKNKENRKSLQTGLDSIREDLEARGVVGDNTGIKFDNKIYPLRYFQEGSVIVPVEQYVEEVRRFGSNTPSGDRKTEGYKASMVGNAELTGQLDAVLDAVAQAEKVMSRISVEGKGRQI